MLDVQERRCDECGVAVGTADEFCPDCWGENLVLVSGPALADLQQWEAYVNSQRPAWGEEQCYTCTQCGERSPDAIDTFAYGWLCGRCHAHLF
jgi:hypothetical protein